MQNEIAYHVAFSWEELVSPDPELLYDDSETPKQPWVTTFASHVTIIHQSLYINPP